MKGEAENEKEIMFCDIACSRLTSTYSMKSDSSVRVLFIFYFLFFIFLPPTSFLHLIYCYNIYFFVLIYFI